MKLKSDNLRVVLFDWDGTLAESSPPRVVAVNQVLKEYGLPDWNNIKYKRNSRISFMDNFPNMFGIYAKEAYEKYCKLYLDIIKNGINGYPKAKELIELLRAKGIKIGLMTNKDRKLLEFELPLLYPLEYFDKIVCGHEAFRDKPHAEHALYTLKGMIEEKNISPETVWIVGDSQLDNLCASSVNALPIRINYAPCEKDLCECKNILYFEDYNAFYEAIL